MPKGDNNKRKTHCPRGHEYRYRRDKGQNWRYCLVCQKGRRSFGSTAAYDAALEFERKHVAKRKHKQLLGSIRLGWDDGDDPCEYRR